MDLQTYLRLKKISGRSFAKKIGVSYSSMRNYLRGRSFPNSRTCRAIEMTTKEVVNIDDMLKTFLEIKKENSSQ